MEFDNQTIEMFNLTRLPENYWTSKVSKVQEGPHKEVIFDWFTNIKTKLKNKKGLIITGPYGRGKSSCAAIILKAALAYGNFGLWLNCREMRGLKSLQEMFDEETSLLDRAKEVPILVMDELIVNEKTSNGKQPFEISIFEDIIRHRVGKRKVTIITTNHQAKTIESNAKGLAAILQEACDWLVINGDNLRA